MYSRDFKRLAKEFSSIKENLKNSKGSRACYSFYPVWATLKKNACAQYLPRLKITSENFPGVQWLGLRTFTAEGLGSIPGWGTI